MLETYAFRPGGTTYKAPTVCGVPGATLCSSRKAIVFGSAANDLAHKIKNSKYTADIAHHVFRFASGFVSRCFSLHEIQDSSDVKARPRCLVSTVIVLGFIFPSRFLKTLFPQLQLIGNDAH